MTTQQSIRRSIDNIEGWLGKYGLEIGFTCEGREELIELDQYDSADLLVSAGIIDGYRDGMVSEDGSYKAWSDFVDEISLNEKDFVQLIVTYKMRQVCHRVNSAA